MDKMRVLFVCTGNICRSPMAEVIFSNMLKQNGRKDVIVKSAGTGAYPGEYMTDTARKALVACGERTGNKPRLSTRFTEEMIPEYDHIVCMSKNHKYYIDPDGLYEHIYTLSDTDIFDPYGCNLETYIAVCKELQDELKLLYNKICGSR